MAAQLGGRCFKTANYSCSFSPLSRYGFVRCTCERTPGTGLSSFELNCGPLFSSAAAASPFVLVFIAWFKVLPFGAFATGNTPCTLVIAYDAVW